MATTKKVSRQRAHADKFDAALAAEQGAPGGAPADLTPAPTPVASTAPVASAAAPAAPLAPAPAAPASAAPTVDWEARFNELRTQTESERAQLTARESEFTTQLEAARAETQAQLEALNAQVTSSRTELEAAHTRVREFERAQTFEVDLTGLEHISSDAARELQEKVFKPVLNRIVDDSSRQITELRGQLADRDARIDQGFGKIEQDTAASKRARTNRLVLAQHPDFAQVTGTQAFAQFKQGRIPGSRTTWGAEMAAAYAAGDAAYVNEALGEFKKTQEAAPTLQQVAAAPAGTAGTTVATQPAASEPKFRYTDLDKWKGQRRRGEITRKQELDLIKAFNVAETAGEVQ